MYYLCLRQNDPVLSRCAPDHFGARENTFLDFPSRQHIISYTMNAVLHIPSKAINKGGGGVPVFLHFL